LLAGMVSIAFGLWLMVKIGILERWLSQFA
jgi:hypothetical protein